MVRLPHIEPRRIGCYLAILCLLAPAFTVLAVQTHQELAAHHQLSAHNEALDRHADWAEAKANHDHHEHEVRESSAGAVVSRHAEPSCSLPPTVSVFGSEALISAQGDRADIATLHGAAAPTCQGHPTLLHCSLLI